MKKQVLILLSFATLLLSQVCLAAPFPTGTFTCGDNESNTIVEISAITIGGKDVPYVKVAVSFLDGTRSMSNEGVGTFGNESGKLTQNSTYINYGDSSISGSTGATIQFPNNSNKVLINTRGRFVVPLDCETTR